MTSEVLASEAGPTGAPGQRHRPLPGFVFEPHHCFACGELNANGLGLRLHVGEQGAWTETTLDAAFEGWDGIAHGGIVCALLDEVMAWSVIGRGTWGVTARLNVSFRRPVHVGTRIRADGWVIAATRRVARTKGRVIDAATGDVLAQADGTFVPVRGHELEALRRRYGFAPRADTSDRSDTTDQVDQAVPVKWSTHRAEGPT